MDKLAEEDTGEAFKFGVWLTTLPQVSDKQQEWENKWHRGNGLVLLGDLRLSDRFADALGEDEKLRVAVSGFMDFDPKLVQTLGVTSKHPEAFNFVTDLKLILGLKDTDVLSQAKALIHKAKTKIEDREIRRLVRLFNEIFDTQELYQFFVTNGYISDESLVDYK